jgi:hypothetical protein
MPAACSAVAMPVLALNVCYRATVLITGGVGDVEAQDVEHQRCHEHVRTLCTLEAT